MRRRFDGIENEQQDREEKMDKALLEEMRRQVTQAFNTMKQEVLSEIRRLLDSHQATSNKTVNRRRADKTTRTTLPRSLGKWSKDDSYPILDTKTRTYRRLRALATTRYSEDTTPVPDERTHRIIARYLLAARRVLSHGRRALVNEVDTDRYCTVYNRVIQELAGGEDVVSVLHSLRDSVKRRDEDKDKWLADFAQKHAMSSGSVPI
jgi:hypothetical protein